MWVCVPWSVNRPLCLHVTRGLWGVLLYSVLVKLCLHTLLASACVCMTYAWLYWSQPSQFAGGGVFHCDPMWLCVHRAWSDSVSTTRCTAATKHCTLLCMSAPQKSSCLCMHSLSSNSEVMIFIPVGVLDKLPLSPQTKRICGRVSFCRLLTTTGNSLFWYHIDRQQTL